MGGAVRRVLGRCASGCSGRVRRRGGLAAVVVLAVAAGLLAPVPAVGAQQPPEGAAPSVASAVVSVGGDVVVGWPSFDGVSAVHVRARSGNGHGTRWGYSQTGNWYVFSGLPSGVWVIEVLKTDFATKLTPMMVVTVPEPSADPPQPAAEPEPEPAVEPEPEPEPAAEPEPAPVPSVSVTAGSGVTEGSAASFTVSASPAPAVPLVVSLSVSQSGDFAAAGSTGSKTVTVPVSGSVSYSVATVDDSVDEADGSVTVSVGSGDGYSVGSAGSASVAVADDDDPPPVIPTVTVAAGGAVTEGSAAVFTVSASPAPSVPLSVSLSVSQSGDFAVSGSTGSKTVTVPVSGSVSYSVATVDDSADEADGSVTVTVGSGSGYSVGSAGSASVAVADDDVAPVPQDTTPQPQDPPPAVQDTTQQDSTPQPQPCVSGDSVLVAQVAAKAVRHRATGRADLLAMFTAVHAALTGDGVYTTGDIKGRPDKQGAKWQTGTGLNSLWTAVYAELDRLEACRDAQPQDSLPQPSVETVDGTPPLSEYNNPPQPAGTGERVSLSASWSQDGGLGFAWSHPGREFCFTLEYLGGEAYYRINWGGSSTLTGSYYGAGPRTIQDPNGGHPTTTHTGLHHGTDISDSRNDGRALRVFCRTWTDAGGAYRPHFGAEKCEAWRITVWARHDKAGTESSQTFITPGCPAGYWHKVTASAEAGSKPLTVRLSAPATAPIHRPNRDQPARTGGASVTISWDYDPPKDPQVSALGAPWGCYEWALLDFGRFGWHEARTWFYGAGGYTLSHHNSVILSGLPVGTSRFEMDWFPGRNRVGRAHPRFTCHSSLSKVAIGDMSITVVDLMAGAVHL